MSTERIGNIGYFGLIKEVTVGTPLTPTDYIPLYDESIKTNANLQRQDPVYGGKFGTYNVLQGQRDHSGDVTVMAEPNTTGRLFDMLLVKGTTTGSDPYTHPYTLSTSTNPKSYTVDISTGNIVKRYWGVGASSISAEWQDNELRWKIAVSALGSFQGREIATISTITLTLTTTYDPAPNKGLVVGDLVRVYKAATGATLNTTIATVNADGVTITLADSAASFAAGDMIHLRPATPSFSTLQSFLWSKTQFCFGATASAALSATHTPLDPGTTFEVIHGFSKSEGEKRSGSFDPASLVRSLGDARFSIKKFFDTPEDVKRFNALEKYAVVIRCYAGSTNQYEARITLNNIKTDNPAASIKSGGEINYSEFDYIPQQDSSDGQGMDVKVLNALSSI